MAGRFNIGFVDYSKEPSNVGVHVAAYTAATFDAQQTALDSLKAAINAVSLLNERSDTRIVNVIKSPLVYPADPDAQREKKWLVRATDNVTGKSVQFEIPGADLSLLTAQSDSMDITAGAGLTLKNEVEASVKSDIGNAVTVSDVIYVGRNL